MFIVNVVLSVRSTVMFVYAASSKWSNTIRPIFFAHVESVPISLEWYHSQCVDVEVIIITIILQC